MRKLASEIWGLLVPNGRPPSIWLAAKINRLGGCESIPSALTKISQILHKNGLIPASHTEDESQVVVRDALCPDHDAALQVKRHTAWCKLKGSTCPNLMKYGENYAKCKALLQERQGSGYWWDLKNQQQQKKEPEKKRGGLSTLLMILGPAAITGLTVWKMKEREIEMMRRPPNTSSDAYDIVNNILKAHGLTFAYDTDTMTFKLQKGTITLTKQGGASMQGRGKRMKATKRDLMDKVFEFASALQ